MKILSRSVVQTLSIGRRIALKLLGGEVILLSGPLGAGKTALAKGIAKGLGIDQTKIISPTFVLLRIHKGKYLLNHFDLYRLKTCQDILSLGFDEYLYSDAITLIEWPERLKFLLPKEFLKIKLCIKGKHQRGFQFIAKGKRYKQLLGEISEDIRN